MNLSGRASKYLNTLTRDLKWSSDEEQTKAYLESQNISYCDSFLRYQTLYSGYELTIKDDPGQSFSASLFSQKQIIKNETLELEKVGNRLIEVCGEHKTAQFTFFITERGEICTLDEDDLPNILHDSFDKMLEEYALRNEIYNWDSNPYYFEVKNLEELTNMMNSEFHIISECSDQYSIWWKNENLIAVKGVWLDRPEAYFHVYGRERSKCDSLVEGLKTKEILK
ncbi:hypothetical protein KMW28_24340 [Flammeovirga yaeyamensis]|uniref:Uncharacterized protein n=1 Tax=Flammeovirga yaeyamensis TaxID=367791 RepID=A0AAX1NCR8_9BACT|nr:hypothetical protein [Flammeovirga yaeyamensis]NMF38733.1 hypothetical protein [Flammeovirga yaeyamensis]QWG04025.1 hypothetical protein KMW28_24340 [Flammeovirga yaeyamensis]